MVYNVVKRTLKYHTIVIVKQYSFIFWLTINDNIYYNLMDIYDLDALIKPHPLEENVRSINQLPWQKKIKQFFYLVFCLSKNK